MSIFSKTQLIPLIAQYFNPMLLSAPYPRFCENSKDLEEMRIYIEKLWEKKNQNGKLESKKEQYYILFRTFLLIYESIKIKEKELEKETRHPTQRPFYYFGSTDEKSDKVFRRTQWSCKRRKYRE